LAQVSFDRSHWATPLLSQSTSEGGPQCEAVRAQSAAVELHERSSCRHESAMSRQRSRCLWHATMGRWLVFPLWDIGRGVGG
jgi:hypothetical protein